jgi:peptidoglycan/LPS O-acetylase OafA/YrhL
VTATLTRPVFTAPIQREHRRDVEGLRAVAVLLVVLYHCGVPFLPGGYAGVDVFFVISGYLITGLLVRERSTTGRIALGSFYARRIRRLLPAAMLVIAATVAAAYRFLPPLRAPQVAFDALATIGYGLNYRLALAGVDYLQADAPPSPLQHFWSLAVEEQFYLVWPLLLIVCWQWRKPMLVFVTVASLGLSVWQTAANPTWAYFGLHTRAWELGAGALIAVFGGRRLPRFVTVIGLVAILLAAVLFTDRTAFPGFAALVPVAGAAAVLLAESSVLDPLRWLGRISYSWYLWHWPFLVFGGAHRWAAVAGSLIAAVGTYYLVENPIRRTKSGTRRTLAVGLIATMIAGFIYAGVGLLPVAGDSSYAAASLTVLRTSDLSAAVPVVPENLVPELERATSDQPRLYRDGCSSGFTDATIRKPCVYGSPASATTVVLFGDSHAGAWFPAVEAVAAQRGWKLVVVTKSACSAASVLIYQDKLHRPFEECTRWRESAWGYIASLHPAIVVMSSAAAGGDLVGATGAADQVWTDGWARSTDQLARTGARLYLLEDTPYQRQDVPECLSAHRAEPAACAVDRADALPNLTRRRMIDDALRSRCVTTIDPTPWFCTTTTCPVIVGNVLVYRDASHVTATYSRLLAPLLAPYLKL